GGQALDDAEEEKGEEEEEEGEEGEEELKVWNVADLGLQALLSVSSAVDPLARLEEISQNFPSHASLLSSLDVPEGLRNEAQTTYQFAMQKQYRPGTLFVAGSPINLDDPSFSPFEVLRSIRREASLSRGLGMVGAPRGSIIGDSGQKFMSKVGSIIWESAEG
ncbi:unnamed protein product, partial [Discosporangium mesarthrocarpum]